MSTTQGMQDQFNTDFSDLQDAGYQYQADMTAEKQAETNYKNIILKKLDACQTADQILMYLQMYVFQNSLPPSDPHADDCLFGIYGDQVGLQGQALKVNSYLTAVHNDLQKMVDSNSTDTTVVYNVANDLDRILSELHGDSALQNAIDPTALGNLQNTDFTLRQEFYVYGDTNGYYDSTGKFVPYNPDPVPDPTAQGSSYTYHFVYDTRSPGYDFYLNNFADMEKYMKLTGDQFEATEGYKNLTDNLNSDTGMTQTVNSEINEKINQLTNFIKTLLGFYENGLLQPSMKLINVAIQNQSKGS